MLKGIRENSRGYPRIGKLRLGKKEGKRPVSLGYFLVDAPNAEQVREIYGAEPQTLKVHLPEALNSRVWDAHYKWYTASGLHCMGDGEVGRRLGDDGKLHEFACADRGCEYPLPYVQNGKERPPRCGPKGILMLKIVGVDSVGAYHLPVNGMGNIQRCNTFLEALAASTPDRGAGAPFEIALVEERRGGLRYHRLDFRETADTTVVRIEGDKAVDADGVVTSSDGTEIRDAFFGLIREKIEDHTLQGFYLTAGQKNLDIGYEMTEDGAQARMNKFTAWLAEYERTKNEPVADHEDDHEFAQAAFDDAIALGVDISEDDDWQAWTRAQARDMVRYLKEVFSPDPDLDEDEALDDALAEAAEEDLDLEEDLPFDAPPWVGTE